ncbi:NAD(P)-dependent oxidoreductase [Pseudochelatococcus sp. B33]
MRLFVFGLGYTALTLIARERGRFSHIAGTVRTPEKAEALRVDGVDAHVFGDDAAITDAARADAVLASVPPSPAGDPALEWLGRTRVTPSAGWIGYLSTVGVYGDHAGAWVDENSPTLTHNARSQWRIAAEQAWLDLAGAVGARGFVFRLPGIYGPGRNSLRDVAQGKARNIVKAGQVFNRAHVADIAAAIAATFAADAPGGVYNVTDDEPASQGEVVTFAARLLGVPSPAPVPFETAALSEMARSFHLENKRVSNARLKALPGFSLTYPTYREGLAALFAAGEGRVTA